MQTLDHFAIKLMKCVRVRISNNTADIVCFTETWLQNGILDSVIQLDNYALHRDDLPASKKGVAHVFTLINA